MLMLAKREQSHFLSYLKLGSKQNANPYLEQLKLFLLLAKAAVNWMIIVFPKKEFALRCDLFWQFAFDREMLR